MGSLRPNYIMKLLIIFGLLIGISWAQLDCSNCAYNSYQANICCATGNTYCCQFANNGNNQQGGQVGGSEYYSGGSSSSNQGSGLTWTGHSNNNGGSNYYPGGSNYNPGGSNYNPGGSNYNPGGNSNPGGSNYNPGIPTTPRPRYIRLNPIFNGNTKRGNCPALNSRPDYSNSGVVMFCNRDRHCPGQQKCCRRGGNTNLGNKICKQHKQQQTTTNNHKQPQITT